MDSSSTSKKAPSEADLAQAFLELSKGEKTAQALEANLTTLEKKLDDLLASFEESERLRVEATNDATAKPTRPDDESSREDSSSSTSKAKTDGKTEN